MGLSALGLRGPRCGGGLVPPQRLGALLLLLLSRVKAWWKAPCSDAFVNYASLTKNQANLASEPFGRKLIVSFSNFNTSQANLASRV